MEMIRRLFYFSFLLYVNSNVNKLNYATIAEVFVLERFSIECRK